MAKKNTFNRRIEKDKPRRKIGRYALLLVLMIPVVYLARDVDFKTFIPKINVDEKVQITNVLIEGELNYTDKHSLQREIVDRLGQDFIRTDLKAIQKATSEIAWVRAATVSRVWPRSIKIGIEEQQPIARWGEKGFLNRYGEVVLVEDISSLSQLPVLSGPESEAYDIAARYLTFANLMSEFQLYVSALDVSDAGDWHVEVNRQFKISLGRHDLSVRLERFLYLYGEQLMDRYKDIERVDMRYKKGLAVKWKKATEFENTRDSKLVSR